MTVIPMSSAASKDTLENIDPELLTEALAICLQTISIIEKNSIPRFTNRLQPCLTRFGFYFDVESDPENFRRFLNLVLFQIDGARSTLDLAEPAGLDFLRLTVISRVREGRINGEISVSFCVIVEIVSTISRRFRSTI